ncbi:hypothetical protein HDU99_003101 [Rhizoclosmatium hyalinum]|nr:hypothetical protein HDU99_003101 [Rhizoclosmatium hyalinum]
MDLDDDEQEIVPFFTEDLLIQLSWMANASDEAVEGIATSMAVQILGADPRAVVQMARQGMPVAAAENDALHLTNAPQIPIVAAQGPPQLSPHILLLLQSESPTDIQRAIAAIYGLLGRQADLIPAMASSIEALNAFARILDMRVPEFNCLWILKNLAAANEECVRELLDSTYDVIPQVSENLFTINHFGSDDYIAGVKQYLDFVNKLSDVLNMDEHQSPPRDALTHAAKLVIQAITERRMPEGSEAITNWFLARMALVPEVAGAMDNDLFVAYLAVATRAFDPQVGVSATKLAGALSNTATAAWRIYSQGILSSILERYPPQNWEAIPGCLSHSQTRANIMEFVPQLLSAMEGELDGHLQLLHANRLATRCLSIIADAPEFQEWLRVESNFVFLISILFRLLLAPLIEPVTRLTAVLVVESCCDLLPEQSSDYFAGDIGSQFHSQLEVWVGAETEIMREVDSKIRSFLSQCRVFMAHGRSLTAMDDIREFVARSSAASELKDAQYAALEVVQVKILLEKVAQLVG